MHITKLTDYSLILLCEMKYGEIISSKSLSEITKVPFATVNKLLRILVKNGLCQSKGGKTGGFYLTKQHSEISIADVILSIEGPNNHFTECSIPNNLNGCQFNGHCKISKKIQLIDQEIFNLLKTKLLSDLK